MIKRSLLIWTSIIPLAILNGALRESVLTPSLGESYGMFISGLTLCLMIFLLVYFLFSYMRGGTAQTYLKIGLIWIIYTILFESGFGLLQGESIKEILKAYDIRTGNIWLLIVFFIGIVPWLVMKIKTRKVNS